MNTHVSCELLKGNSALLSLRMYLKMFFLSVGWENKVCLSPEGLGGDSLVPVDYILH